MSALIPDDLAAHDWAWLHYVDALETGLRRAYEEQIGDLERRIRDLTWECDQLCAALNQAGGR